MPLVEVARAKTKQEALDGWSAGRRGTPDVVPMLEPADVLVDGMRGSSSLWYRVRVNLQHVPPAAATRAGAARGRLRPVGRPHLAGTAAAGILTKASVRENLPFVATYEAVLDALGDRTRRQIVKVLRGGPVTVGEIAEQVGVSRPAVSQHLRVLQASRLVDYTPVGTRHVYRVDPAGVRDLRVWLDGFWDAVLGQFAQYAAEDAAKDRPSAQVNRKG